MGTWHFGCSSLDALTTPLVLFITKKAVAYLNSIAELVEARVASGETIRLPEIRTIGKNPAKLVSGGPNIQHSAVHTQQNRHCVGRPPIQIVPSTYELQT